jgi:hypothetical protein
VNAPSVASAISSSISRSSVSWQPTHLEERRSFSRCLLELYLLTSVIYLLVVLLIASAANFLGAMPSADPHPQNFALLARSLVVRKFCEKILVFCMYGE